MARLFTSGFEFNTTTADVEFGGITGAPTISNSLARTGTYCGIVSGGATSEKSFFYRYASADSSADAYCRFYFLIDTLPSAETAIGSFGTSGGPTTVGINMTTTGQLKLIDNNGSPVGSASSALNTGQWYRIELRCFHADTIMELRVDGHTVASSSGGATQASSVFIWGCDIGGFTPATTVAVRYDDLAINDATGSSQNTWPGEGRVLRLKPNASGDVNSFATQTGGTAGSSNNFTRVNEVTPDDATTFNGSNTLNQEDLFNVDDSGIGATDVVNVVQVVGRFRNSVADATSAVKFEIEKAASGTISQSSAIIPNTTTWNTNTTSTPHLAPLTTYADPTGAAWTKATLDTMQIGYKLTAAGTNRIDVTSVSAIVDYTPATTRAIYIPNRIPNKRVGPMAMRYNFRQPYYPVAAGVVGTQYTNALTGGLSFTGSYGPTQTNKALNGGVSFVGTLSRFVSHLLTGSLSFSGAVNKLTSYPLVSAALSFVGSIAKRAGKAVSGALSFSGVFIGGNPISIVFNASLSFVGNLNKFTTYPLVAAALSFVGNLNKLTTKIPFSGAVSFVGFFITGAVHKLTVTAALSFSGAFSKQTNKALTASLSFSGAVSRLISHVLSGAVSFTTSFLNGNPITMILTASLSFVGSLTKRTSVPLSGALSFVGSIGKRIGKAVAAAVSFAGNLASQLNHAGGTVYTMVFTSSLRFVGHIPYGPASQASIIILTDGRLAKWLGGILYLPL